MLAIVGEKAYIEAVSAVVSGKSQDAEAMAVVEQAVAAAGLRLTVPDFACLNVLVDWAASWRARAPVLS